MYYFHYTFTIIHTYVLYITFKQAFTSFYYMIKSLFHFFGSSWQAGCPRSLVSDTLNLFWLLFFFRENQRFFFGLFRCFGPVSKQPKQTELMVWGIKKVDILTNLLLFRLVFCLFWLVFCLFQLVFCLFRLVFCLFWLF
jgi:hypothetical protein